MPSQPIWQPDWYYDDRRQVGLDFESAEQVAAYDARQGTDSAYDRETLARLRLAPGTVLIDIGCGTGNLVRTAAEAGIAATGFDVSPAMLDFARGKAEGLALARFRLGGFLSLDWQEEPVDAVTTSYALHHLPDFWKQVAFMQMRDLLKPGGRLLLRDVAFSFPAEEIAAGVEDWLQEMSHDDGQGFTRDDFTCHLREEYSTFGWVLEGMLARADFRLVERRDSSPAYFDGLYERAEG